jgi:hypothetical protein
MATAISSAEICVLDAPASRRFYVHVGSLGFLIAAQSAIFEEVAYALALSGASRALDQAAEDWEMFPSSGPKFSLAQNAANLHKLAADALRTSFQCIVHLVPQRFGATELLLGPTEQINAWCYEDGYLTYATDENAAAIMYTETGSLRELRSQIRRSPDFDPALQMISGHSLFLFDQKDGAGLPSTGDAAAAQLHGDCDPGRTGQPSGGHAGGCSRGVRERVGADVRRGVRAGDVPASGHPDDHHAAARDAIRHCVS